MTVRELLKFVENKAKLDDGVFDLPIMMGRDHDYRVVDVYIDDTAYGTGEPPIFAMVIV